jgi:hypothetical protein
MKLLLLSPASYGKAYRTTTEAVAAWNNGADFNINDMAISASYCSRRDIPALKSMGYSGVQLLNPKTDTTLATVRF